MLFRSLLADYLEPISVLSLGAVLGLGHLSAQTLREWFHGLAMGAINFENDPEKQRVNDETAAVIDAELRPLMTRLQREPDGSTIASMLTSGCPVDHPRSIEQVMPSLKVIILGGMQELGHGAASCLVGVLQPPDQLAWVREFKGLVFAYMGPPAKRPVLPRWEVFEDLQPGESIYAHGYTGYGVGADDTIKIIPINWLQDRKSTRLNSSHRT